MQAITLNITNLNSSLQVGDIVYAAQPETQYGAKDQQGFSLGAPLGENRLVGILKNITFNTDGTTTLDVDDTLATLFSGIGYQGTPTIVNATEGVKDFLMFSKYSQTDGDVNGYYAKANFMNDSREKAELFAVSSEIVINSK